MPPSPVFSKKPPTAPCAVLVLVTPVSAPPDPPDYVAQLNSAVKCNEAGIIIAVLCYPAFAGALLGYISSAKSLPFPLPADWACYLGFLNLVSTPLLSLTSSFVFDFLTGYISKSSALDLF